MTRLSPDTNTNMINLSTDWIKKCAKDPNEQAKLRSTISKVNETKNLKWLFEPKNKSPLDLPNLANNASPADGIKIEIDESTRKNLAALMDLGIAELIGIPKKLIEQAKKELEIIYRS